MAESISLLLYCTKSQQSDSIPILFPKEKRLEIEYKKKKNLKKDQNVIGSSFIKGKILMNLMQRRSTWT